MAVEKLGQVVRVRPLEREADDRPFLVGSTRAEDSQALDPPQDFVGVRDQGTLVRGQGDAGELIQVVDRRAQADGLGDRRRAGLELPGNLVPLGPLAASLG